MSISTKTTLPILLTVVGGFVAYVAFYAFLSRTRSDSAFIEIAGMQAVRAEQVGRLAYATVEGFDWAREPLETAIASFDEDLRRLEREGGAVVLEVADHGSGIPSEKLEAVSNGETAGVGIAGMRERVELLGGTFDFFSSSRGARVRVRLQVPESRSSVEGERQL